MPKEQEVNKSLSLEEILELAKKVDTWNVDNPDTLTSDRFNYSGSIGGVKIIVFRERTGYILDLLPWNRRKYICAIAEDSHLVLGEYFDPKVREIYQIAELSIRRKQEEQLESDLLHAKALLK